MLKREYYAKTQSKEGYTEEEVRWKLGKVIEALSGPNSKYKDFKIEPDPRGGFQVVAYYEVEDKDRNNTYER